jgi:hypothetical protein
VGSYTLDVRLEADVTTKIKVVVAPEVAENTAAPAETETEAAEAPQA